MHWIVELAHEVGLKRLAQMEVDAVRTRPVPPQLLVDIALAGPLAAPSPRERVVLALLAEGRQQPEIAAELHIDLETVRTHTRKLRYKLGAHTQAHLIVRGIQLGYLQV
jgi:DNA-binding CsgD family transcriptional regulator